MKTMRIMRRYLAAALAFSAALTVGCTGIRPTQQGTQGANKDFVIFTAERQEQPKHPSAIYKNEDDMFKEDSGFGEAMTKWNEANEKRLEAAQNAPDIGAFTRGLYAELMRGEAGNNVVCSPASVYIALAMLAEVTGGETRAEILKALGASDIGTLRNGVAALLKAETVDDGVQTSLIGNSFWLNESIKYKEEPLKALAEIYGASSFRGDPNDEAFKQALRDWLNENTGGLLKEAAKGVEPGTLITLANTIYFKARWENEFPKSLTKDDVFHAVSGDKKVPFMHGVIMHGNAVKGENFTAVSLPLKSGGSMLLFLPDEGVYAGDIMQGALDAVFADTDFGGDYLINIALPKFDVGSNLDLIPAVKAMGVGQCFASPDFGPLLEEDQDAVVSRINHAARVKIDEEGLEAAAYTVITADGAMFMDKTLDIAFDRPFMFVITGTSGAPLFMGAVNSL